MRTRTQQGTALVTGASSGIGRELAKVLAANGHDLVLVARREPRLREIAEELVRRHHVTVAVLPKDLALPTAAEEIYAEVQRQGIEVQILVNAAGFNVYGPFASTALAQELAMIQVVKHMLQRRSGAILNVTSSGSFSPAPLDSVYCATKAHVLSFSEALSEEPQGTGVTVTALCPGPTATEFAARAEMLDPMPIKPKPRSRRVLSFRPMKFHPKQKKRGHIHHRNLRRALFEAALRIIETEGVERLTLRALGAKLRVSRTALYRHFSDKPALLAAIGREGFRILRLALTEAREARGRGQEGFEAMGYAYVHFAIAHPSHYQVMFGRFVESCPRDADLAKDAAATFQVFVDSIVEQQQAGLIRRDDPFTLARFIWAVVHGLAMLMIDGQLGGVDERGERLNQFATQRIRDAISSAP